MSFVAYDQNDKNAEFWLVFYSILAILRFNNRRRVRGSPRGRLSSSAHHRSKNGSPLGYRALSIFRWSPFSWLRLTLRAAHPHRHRRELITSPFGQRDGIRDT